MIIFTEWAPKLWMYNQQKGKPMVTLNAQAKKVETPDYPPISNLPSGVALLNSIQEWV